MKNPDKEYFYSPGFGETSRNNSVLWSQSIAPCRNGFHALPPSPARVSAAELKKRAAKLKPFKPRVKSGWLARYQRLVGPADIGAVLQ